MMRRAMIEPGTLRRPQGEQGALPHTVDWWSIPRLGMDSRKDGILEFSRERLHTLPSYRGRHDPAPRALLRCATPNANIQSQARASSRSRYRGFARVREMHPIVRRASPRAPPQQVSQSFEWRRAARAGALISNRRLHHQDGARLSPAARTASLGKSALKAGLGTVRAAVRCVRQISSSGCAASM